MGSPSISKRLEGSRTEINLLGTILFISAKLAPDSDLASSVVKLVYVEDFANPTLAVVMVRLLSLTLNKTIRSDALLEFETSNTLGFSIISVDRDMLSSRQVM